MDLEEESFSAEEGHRSHSKKRKKKKSKHHHDTEELEEPGQDTDVVVLEESEFEGLSSPSKKKKKKKSKEAEEVEEDSPRPSKRETTPTRAPSTSSKKVSPKKEPKTPEKQTATRKGLSAVSTSKVPNSAQGLAAPRNGMGVSADSAPKKITNNGKPVTAKTLKHAITKSRTATLNNTWSTLTSDAVVVARPSTSKGGATVESEERTAFIGMQIVASMSQDDIEELLRKIDLQCPANDTKRDKQRELQINWGEVAFSSYGPVQCKAVWFYLRTQARSFRILHEVVDEIRMNFKADYWRFMKKVIESSPGFPKQPYATGGFQFFCKQLWDKYKDHQSKMNAKVENFLKFQTKCYEEWREMSDEKKEEFHKKAKLLGAEHKLKVKEYYAKFPGFAPRTDSLLDKDGNPEKKVLTGAYRREALKVSNELYKDAPQLPFTPLQLYVNSKMNRLDPPPTLEELPDLKNHYVEKWKDIAESKKLKWVKSCVKKSEQYLEDVDEYKKGHPLYLLPKEFKIARLISRDEFNMWAKAHGEPPKPCHKSFDIFLDEFRNSGQVEGEGDEDEIAKRALTTWDALDWYHKDLYKMKLRMQQMTFKKEFEEYYSKLPVVLRAYAIEHAPKKYRKAIEENVGKAPLVLADEEPVGVNCKAETIYIDELRSDKRKRNVSTNDEASQEEDLEGGDSSPKKKKKKKRKKNEEDELEDPLATTSADGTEPSMPLYMMDLTENVQKKYQRGYHPGKTITQPMLGEAMRGIFDGRQFYRRFTPYYYYAKYVIGEECWVDMIRKCGIVRTAAKIIETFNRLDKRQQEIFIHESLKFHNTRRKYKTEISTAEDLCAPKLRYFPGEPKPPPRSAEILYQADMRKERRDTGDDFVTLWTDLTEKEQMVYLKKLYTLNRNYVTEYEKFVKNMTPNDMVEYLVGRCHEWEVVRRKKRYCSYRRNVVDAAAPMFASDTYRAELSDDGQESEPEVYELNGSIAKAMSSSAFSYKKNPFAEKTSQVNRYVDKLAMEVRRKRQMAAATAARRRKTPRPIVPIREVVDSDLPTSDDDDICDLALNKIKYQQEKRFNDKVRDLARYYYPLEEYYDFSPNSNQNQRSSKSLMDSLERSKGKSVVARRRKVDQNSDITTKQKANARKPNTPRKKSNSPVKAIKNKYKTILKSKPGTRRKLKKIPKTPEFVIKKTKAKRVKVILPKSLPVDPLAVEDESAEIDDSTAYPQITEVFSLPRDTDTHDMQEEPTRMPSLMLVCSSPRSQRVDQEISSTDEMPPDNNSDTTVTKVESSSDDLDEKTTDTTVTKVESSSEDLDEKTMDATDFPHEFAPDLPSPELFPMESTIEDEYEQDPYGSMFLESQFTAEETDQFNFPY